MSFFGGCGRRGRNEDGEKRERERDINRGGVDEGLLGSIGVVCTD